MLFLVRWLAAAASVASVASVSASYNRSTKIDYVIVGGGPAGFVLAESLSRDPTVSVVLLEAGPDGINNTLVNTPAYYILQSEYLWNYTTQPDPSLGGNAISLAQGRAFGGGSSVNGMAYCRGAASVFDEWAEISGNPGLAWDSIFQDFVETTRLGLDSEGYAQVVNASAYGNGPLEVTPTAGKTGLELPFIEAVKAELGLDETDLNDGTGIGLELGITAIRGGSQTRSYARNSFGALAEARPNVRLVPNAWVSRIGFEGDTAVNVTYHTNNNETLTLEGSEIIVSAGAIGSPKLLMLSGVGPRDQLTKLGIPIVADIPEVGTNLRDHPIALLELAVTPDVLTQWQWQVNSTEGALATAQYAANRSGPLGWNNGYAFGEFRLPDSVYDGVNGSHYLSLPKDRPHVLIEYTTTPFLSAGNVSAVALWVSLVQPQAAGYLALNSSDYRDDPMLFTSYYGSDADRVTIVAAYRKLMAVVGHDAITRHTVETVYPTQSLETMTDDDIFASIQNQTYSFRHPVGTVGLGSALGANWRPKGLKGIRVVDSSTFPFPSSCHPQAVTYALAHLAAKDIINADRYKA